MTLEPKPWGILMILTSLQLGNLNDPEPVQVGNSRDPGHDPSESIYHYLLGCTYTYLNEIDRAISHLTTATELDDSQDIYWGQLGWVYGYNRDIDKGIEHLKRALALNPANVNSLKDVCVLYAKNQRWSEALVCIEEAMEQDPDNSKIIRIKQDIEFFESEVERLKRE